jgi:transcriptional/translational regulatory protein YebC/TACO1
MFRQEGVVRLAAGDADPEELALELLDAVDVGVDGDVAVDGGSVQVVVAPSHFEDVRRTLEGRGYTIENAEITMAPSTSVVVDAKQAPVVLRLLESLEDQDDVQQVYANVEIPDEVLESVG